jgi:hypothetical protein
MKDMVKTVRRITTGPVLIVSVLVVVAVVVAVDVIVPEETFKSRHPNRK